MMTTHEKKEVLRALRSQDNLEFSSSALEKMLEDELSRPAEEMDTGLVQALVELMEDTASDAAQCSAWERLVRRLQRRTSPALQRMLRVAAVLIAAAGLARLTWHTAEAINDRFLVRKEIPGASTFVVMNNPEVTIPVTDVPSISIDPQLTGSLTVTDASDYTSATYDSLADCPETLYGYPAVPAWLPDGYEHVASVFYEDSNLAVLNHHFMHNGQSLIFDVTIYTNPGVVVYAETRTADDQGYETYAAGIPVYYYLYGEQSVPCAHYLHGVAEYNIVGAISHEEMRVIIESTMNSIDWRNEP